MVFQTDLVTRLDSNKILYNEMKNAKHPTVPIVIEVDGDKKEKLIGEFSNFKTYKETKIVCSFCLLPFYLIIGGFLCYGFIIMYLGGVTEEADDNITGAYKAVHYVNTNNALKSSVADCL